MSYEKLLVDNLVCKRRFHLAFDTENKKVEEITILCNFCNKVIFTAKNHPKVECVRQENLVTFENLSDRKLTTCAYSDQLMPLL